METSRAETGSSRISIDGSIANTLVPVSTVDIGLAQLAMHSVCETAGVQDVADLCKAMKVYFGKTLTKNGSGEYHI